MELIKTDQASNSDSEESNEDNQVLIFLEGEWTDDFRWGLYASGFKWSADMLVDSSEKEELISRVYPIMFLYRHYLELKLKEILVIFKDCLAIGESMNKYLTHDLLSLWKTVRRLLDKQCCFADDWKQACESIDNLIKRHNRMDKDSYNFRYPFDKNGISSLHNLSNLDIRCHTYVDIEKERSLIESASIFLEDATERLVAHCSNVDHILEYEEDQGTE